MTRVLMVSSLWPPEVIGGAELYAHSLASALTADGHTVGAVTLGVPGDDVVTTVKAWPVDVRELRQSSLWRRAGFHGRDVWRRDTSRAIFDAIAQFNPDVVHTHAVHGMSVAALTAPGRAGVAHVHTLHDFWLRCWRSTLTRRHGGPCGRSCRAIAAWRSGAMRIHPPDVTIAISRAVLEQHPALLTSGRAKIIRHAVEDAAPRTRPIPRPGAAVFGYIGQVNPNKGISVLLDAW